MDPNGMHRGAELPQARLIERPSPINAYLRLLKSLSMSKSRDENPSMSQTLSVSMCSHFEQRSNPMDAGHLLDVNATLHELGGDETLLGKIADIFTRTAPNLLELIHEALAAQDLKRVYGEAHSLKGSVGAFKAPE